MLRKHHFAGKSSTIHSMELNPETNELTVEFHHGGRYVFPCDNHQLFVDFSNAKSPGGFFHKYIKPLGGKKQ